VVAASQGHRGQLKLAKGRPGESRDSPRQFAWGEVLASDDIGRRRDEVSQKHKKPVIASMGSLAASAAITSPRPAGWIVATTDDDWQTSA